MKRTMLILSRIFIAGIILLATVQSTTITSASYDAGSNVLTITFSDSIHTDNILLGRMTFDDDNGGPNPDVVFSGGTVLTEDSLSSELQISLIYSGIIDQWTNPEDGKTRDIWGNDLTLVNAVESMDLSSLQLVVNEGAFINDNAEPFDDTDGNGAYSTVEQFTDLNSNGTWDHGEEFTDANGNGGWDSAEVYIDAIGNGTWDPPEEFTDIDGNGVWNDAEVLFDDANGNGIWDSEDFEDTDSSGTWSPMEIFTDANFNGIWDPSDEYEDANDNDIWDNHEPFTDTNGNGNWDSTEVYIDANGNGVWNSAETLTIDNNSNGVWDSTEVLVIDRDGDGEWDSGEPVTDIFNFNGIWDPGEEFIDVNNNHIWDSAETFTDGNGNGIWDPTEDFEDANSNGTWDPAEDFYDTPLNGVWDQNAGETYEDINSNGVYDLPDIYYDANGNGQWDRGDEFTDTDMDGIWDSAEPLTDIDGDNVWDDAEDFIDVDEDGTWDDAETLTIDYNANGTWDDAEPFSDANGNGTWDDAEPFSDDNENGVWDSTEVIGDPNENGEWDDGDGFNDNNNNGIWDGVETFMDIGFGFPPQGAGNGVWDFVDDNGNEICDSDFGPNAECEPWTDDNENGICDQETLTYDENGNGLWDPPEGFIDTNGNGMWDPAEEFVDTDGIEGWFPGEEFTDMNGNNVWDDEEPFVDSNNNYVYDEAEPFVDFDGDNEFDQVSEEFTDSNGNGIWDQYEPNAHTTLDVAVSGQDVHPVLISANYDANNNRFTLLFDRPVQFDQIPEDETFQNGPGDGNLNSGEDRNNNGALDFEANINIFKVGFLDGSGNVKMLEGLDQIVQTVDSDTIEILMTRNDSKRLETTLDISSLSMNLSEGAFLDTLYNLSATSTLPVTTTLDSLPLFVDSATYNIAENELLIFFRSKETNKRKIVTDPSPIYSKIALSTGDSSMNLSGIDGTPFVLQDIILRIRQLMLADQRDLEILINEMGTGDTLFLAIDEYAVYDENNNGNLEVINLPVTITSSDALEKQPPQIVSSEIVYDAYTDILTLPWNMGVGFFNEMPIPEKSGVSGNSNLEGIAFYDSSEDSLITFSQGKVYYPSSYDTTCIKLSEADAELLENYPNRAGLTLTVEPFTFYSAGTYNNGNEAVTEDSLFAVNYRWDNTAPMVNEVLFNVTDSTLAITLDELVLVDFLYPEKLTFGGVVIDGEIVVDSAAQYVSNFSVKVSSSAYDGITSLDNSVKINPLFQSVAGAFVNADSTISGWVDMEAAYGRYFWNQSFEAFAPPPAIHFAALRASGGYCDIYVDAEQWNSNISSEDLNQIMTAFETTAPGDSSAGIAGLAQDFLGASIKDTDGNGKVIFVFTDILDEYGLGRSDTKSSLFVHGYSTIADTLDDALYSNHGDIIYLDADPMSLNSTDDDLVATYNAISHEYTRMIMEHNQPDQENWIIESVSAILQKKMVGDVKFFGKSTSPSITGGNQLTYIATGYQSLKGRSDKYNAYLFLSYLQEKYSADSSGWDIIQAIAQSDSIGIKAVSNALVTLGIDTDVKDIFADYGMACYLDAVQADSLYDSRYSFEGFDLQTPPSGKPAAVLKWDASIGKGSPYTKNDILPWSYNYLIMLGYSFDLAGNVNYLSPDLNAEDTLVFNGYDGTSFKVKKLILKSSFLDLMNPGYEVYDFELDDQTGYGTLPVTTDPLFAFKDTLDYAVDGVQLMLLMIAKTDDAQPPATYDFAVSNVVSLPDFSDLYAYQNPGIQNYLDVYVVSQRRVFDHFGNEGAVVEYSVTSGDSGSVALTELISYGSDLVIYHTSKELSTEGTYNFTYQGSDQSGNLFEFDSLTIVVEYYDPASASRIVAGNAEYSLPRESLDNPLMIAAGTIPVHRSVSLPEGFEPMSDIIMFGPNDKQLNRSATVTFFLKEANQTMSIYQFHKGEWRHIGAEIIENSVHARTNSLGQFIVLSGPHGELDKDLVLPQKYTLYQNYPNPFNPVTNISFDLPRQGYVSLVVYDIMGREIVRIIDGQLLGGHHKFRWSGKHNSGRVASSGIYFYQLTAEDFQQTRKMLIIK